MNIDLCLDRRLGLQNLETNSLEGTCSRRLDTCMIYNRAHRTVQGLLNITHLVEGFQVLKASAMRSTNRAQRRKKGIPRYYTHKESHYAMWRVVFWRPG